MIRSTVSTEFAAQMQTAADERNRIFNAAAERLRVARENAEVRTIRICKGCRQNEAMPEKYFCNSAMCNKDRVERGTNARSHSDFQKIRVLSGGLKPNKQSLLAIAVSLMVFALIGLVIGFPGGK